MNALKQLRYNDATNIVRKELPSELKLTASSTIYLTIYDDSGNTVVARAASDQYAATTINAAITAGDSSFVLAVGATALEPGDRIRILDSDDGPDEDLEVEHYDSSTRTVYPKDSLYYSHSSGASVVGLWATDTIDTTDTSSFVKSAELVFAWEHGADESSAFKFDTDLYKVSWVGFGSDDAVERFSVKFASLYDEVRDRVFDIKDEAIRELRFELSAVSLDIDRVIDQETLMVPLILKMGLIAIGFSDTTVTEREMLMDEYGKQFDRLQNLPLWVDEDQDLVKEEDEVDKHIGISYVRGL